MELEFLHFLKYKVKTLDFTLFQGFNKACSWTALLGILKL